MRAVTDLVDRVLGRANQFRDLGILQLRMVLDQPGDCVRLVAALGNRDVFRSLGAGFRLRQRAHQDFHPVRRVCLGFLDLAPCQLSVLQRIDALNTGADLAVGDGLNFEGMQAAEIGDLFKRQRRIVDQPDGRRFRHQRIRHDISFEARYPYAMRMTDPFFLGCLNCYE